MACETKTLNELPKGAVFAVYGDVFKKIMDADEVMNMDHDTVSFGGIGGWIKCQKCNADQGYYYLAAYTQVLYNEKEEVNVQLHK